MQVGIKLCNIDKLDIHLTLSCGISYDIKFLRQSSVDSVRAVITQAESHEADEIEELAVILIRKILSR